MILKKVIYYFLAGLLLSFLSCNLKDGSEELPNLNPKESFTESEAPKEYTHELLNFNTPWGYDKEVNSSRLYPLLVSGKWGEGKSQYNSISKDYPAFVIDYQKTSSTDGQALAIWIKSAIDAGYRIDINRIYLTGFSWGGSSSFKLAKGMYSENMFFAAINRVAGQSQSDLGDEIAKETALWYHIGLEDSETRVEVAKQTLKNMIGYEWNSTVSKEIITDNIDGYSRETTTLTRNGYSMFKYSEYTGMGHTSGPCYKDEDLFPWMFSNSLLYR